MPQLNQFFDLRSEAVKLVGSLSAWTQTKPLMRKTQIISNASTLLTQFHQIKQLSFQSSDIPVEPNMFSVVAFNPNEANFHKDRLSFLQITQANTSLLVELACVAET